jgi:purine-binding chemotaxis protein CheW
MSKSDYYILFTLDDQSFAIDLSNVDRVIRAIEVTPLPVAPEIVLGVINIHGDVIPVVNIRKRLNFRQKDMEVGDQLIIGHTDKRSLALWVDEVQDIVDIANKKVIKQGDILPGIPHIEGVVKLDGDIVYIHDLERFLSLDEEARLNMAMDKLISKKKKSRKKKDVRAEATP